MKSVQKQIGVSLIEILVSIVIVSFGLLGVAGLLTTGLKSTQTSQYRTQASHLAYDMADRMRINRDIALAGQYATAVTATNALAVSDKSEWQNALSPPAPSALTPGLPSGVGAVVMASTTFFTITIQWDESKVGGSATEQFEYKGEL